MKREFGALTLAIGVGIGVSLIGSPASAATPTDLYVNNSATANCSDAGAGTQDQPYCPDQEGSPCW